MRVLDELHLEHPAYGSRRLSVLLKQRGQEVNRKRVTRLLRVMGIEAIYPYLLKGLEITGPNQVWCSDITYIPMASGFMYLVAVMH